MKCLVGICGVLAVCLIAVSLIFCVTGCDSASGIDGLTVTPAMVTLTPTSNIVIFAVTGGTSNSLQLPLVWTVTDYSLGSVIASSGYTATYRAQKRLGQNLVTVIDQYDNEGYATVTQVAEPQVAE